MAGELRAVPQAKQGRETCRDPAEGAWRSCREPSPKGHEMGVALAGTAEHTARAWHHHHAPFPAPGSCPCPAGSEQREPHCLWVYTAWACTASALRLAVNSARQKIGSLLSGKNRFSTVRPFRASPSISESLLPAALT